MYQQPESSPANLSNPEQRQAIRNLSGCATCVFAFYGILQLTGAVYIFIIAGLVAVVNILVAIAYFAGVNKSCEVHSELMKPSMDFHKVRKGINFIVCLNTVILTLITIGVVAATLSFLAITTTEGGSQTIIAYVKFLIGVLIFACPFLVLAGRHKPAKEALQYLEGNGPITGINGPRAFAPAPQTPFGGGGYSSASIHGGNSFGNNPFGGSGQAGYVAPAPNTRVSDMNNPF